MNREIFEYQDETGRQKFADPIRVLRTLEFRCEGDVDETVRLARSENPELAFPATDRLLDGIREAFALPAFDAETGQGAVEDFLLDLYADFLVWMAKKKVTPENLRTSPAPLEAASYPTTSTITPSSACG